MRPIQAGEDLGAVMILINNSPSHDGLRISPQPEPNNDNVNEGILVMGVRFTNHEVQPYKLVILLEI